MEEKSLPVLPGVKRKELESMLLVFSRFRNIQQAIVYGSRVNGNYRRESDVDVYLSMENMPPVHISDMKIRIQQMLSSDVPYPVHIKEDSEIHNPNLRYAIFHGGVKVYP